MRGLGRRIFPKLSPPGGQIPICASLDSPIFPSILIDKYVDSFSDDFAEPDAMLDSTLVRSAPVRGRVWASSDETAGPPPARPRSEALHFQDDPTMSTRLAAIVLVGEDRRHARQIRDDLVREGRKVDLLELPAERAADLPGDVAQLAAVLRKRIGSARPIAVLLVGDLLAPPPQRDKQLQFGELRINVSRHEVLAGAARLHLSKSEFGLLVLLAGRPGHVLTRAELIREFRGEDYPVTSRSVDVHIAGLRRKLGPLAGHLETVRGIGYRFVEVPSAPAGHQPEA